LHPGLGELRDWLVRRQEDVVQGAQELGLRGGCFHAHHYNDHDEHNLNNAINLGTDHIHRRLCRRSGFSRELGQDANRLLGRTKRFREEWQCDPAVGVQWKAP
jgi:hypothetical protein